MSRCGLHLAARGENPDPALQARSQQRVVALSPCLTIAPPSHWVALAALDAGRIKLLPGFSGYFDVGWDKAGLLSEKRAVKGDSSRKERGGRGRKIGCPTQSSAGGVCKFQRRPTGALIHFNPSPPPRLAIERVNRPESAGKRLGVGGLPVLSLFPPETKQLRVDMRAVQCDRGFRCITGELVSRHALFAQDQSITRESKREIGKL